MHDGSASLLWFVPAVLWLVPPFICSRAPVFCTLLCSRRATSIYLDPVATRNNTIPGFLAPGAAQHPVVTHQHGHDVSSQMPSRCSNAPTIAPLPTWIRIGGPGSLWMFPSLEQEGAVHLTTTRWELLKSCRKEHNCRRTCHKFDKIALSPTVIASNTLSAITINIHHRLTIFLSPW